MERKTFGNMGILETQIELVFPLESMDWFLVTVLEVNTHTEEQIPHYMNDTEAMDSFYSSST